MLSRSRLASFAGRAIGLATMAGVLASCDSEPQVVTTPGPAISSTVLTTGKPGTPSLTILTAPAGAVPGAIFSTQPQVEFLSTKGKVTPSERGPVTASHVGAGNVVLGGTTTVSASKGVASFRDLLIPVAGSYTLQFSSPDALPVTVPVTVGCAFGGALQPGDGISIDPTGTTASVSDAGGTFTANVTVTPASCTWTPVSNQSWLVVQDEGVRTGNGTVTYTVDVLSHVAPARTGQIDLGPSSSALSFFTINQNHL
jgi:hypothetical protein